MLATFPGITETFVIREILGLQREGFEISIFAVKRSDSPKMERSLCSPELLHRCLYARPDKLIQHLMCNIMAIFSHPVRYLSALMVFLKPVMKTDPKDFIRSLYHFYCGIGFLREIRRRKIDRLHCHFTAGANMALAINLYAGTPFSFTAHASGDIFVRPLLLDEKVAASSFIVPVCNYSRKYLDSVTGYKYSDKLHRIYNGIDTAEAPRFINSQRDFNGRDNIGGDLFRIVSVGSLWGPKGHATLIKACKILLEKGYPIKCQVIGEGPERSVLSHLIRVNELEESVTIAGYMPLKEVYRSLAQAHVFALLSEVHVSGMRDGFPTVILEAMAMGLPVVSTWMSGIPEIVIHEETGLLVHERDVEGAASALETLIADHELRVRLGLAGRDRVTRMFTSTEAVQSLSALFHQSGR